MNFLDIGLAVILILGLIRGVSRGFLREIFGLVGLAAGLTLALAFSTGFGHVLARWMPQTAAYAAAFLLLFAGTIGLSALIGRAATSLADKTPLGILNRILGAGLGFVKALVAVIVFLAVLHVIPGANGFLKGSRLAPWAQSSGTYLRKQARRLPLPTGRPPVATPGRKAAGTTRPDSI